MLFSSIEFIFLFLPLVVTCYALIGTANNGFLALLWLAAVSLFFYAYWNPAYLALLVLSISVNYAISRILLARRSGKILAAGIAFNLSLIAYFKYTIFAVSTANWITDADFATPDIILPLAISFFTFQKIAYLVDVYQGKIRDIRLLHYIVFVTFFPQLIAGPIVHYNEMVPQFAGRRDWGLKFGDIVAGVSIFVVGLQKKVVVADGIGVYANGLFMNLGGTEPSFVASWIGILAFTLQIYFDFSGYTDMAIGLGRIFGIKLPENFNSPYKAVSIIDFWQRWHMTLSRFLRDYLYIPLGGNRKGRSRKYINIIITMLLGGLWHGAAWTFVFWGALHGAFIIINHLWREARKSVGHKIDRSTAVGRGISRVLTLLCVIVAWVFFRAQNWSDAWEVLYGMAGLNGGFIPQPHQYMPLTWLIVLLIGVLIFPNTQELNEAINLDRTLTAYRLPVAPVIVILGCMALIVVIAKGSSTNDFIYMVF